jgi:Uma2 family endonuclease
MVATRLMTAEDLDAMGPEAEKRYEIIDGVLIEVEGMGGRHGRLSARLVVHLGGHVQRNELGEIFTEATRFKLKHDPDVVVMPDVSFIRADRLPPGDVWERTVPIPPDFATEIASPNDTATEVRRKAQRLLDAGVRLVWIVWPKRREVSVLRLGQPELVVGESGELDGGDVIPGFRLPVASIFG